MLSVMDILFYLHSRIFDRVYVFPNNFISFHFLTENLAVTSTLGTKHIKQHTGTNSFNAFDHNFSDQV